MEQRRFPISPAAPRVRPAHRRAHPVRPAARPHRPWHRPEVDRRIPPAGRGAVAASFLVMLLATVAFSWGALRPGTVFAGLDFVTHHDPFAQTDLASDLANFRQGDQTQLVFPLEFWQGVREGDVQLWEPDLGGGTILGAGVHNRVLSPFNVATFPFLPPALAITAGVVLAVLLAQVGTWWLGRRLGLAPAAATVAAVAYGLSGATVALLVRMQEVHWFPLLLVLLHGAVVEERRRGRWLVGAALAVAGLWFCGFPGMGLFSLLGAGAFAAAVVAVRAPSLRWAAARLATALGVVVLGTGIAAVQLLPTVAFFEVGHGRERFFPTNPYVGLARLADLTIPRFYGAFADGTFWWDRTLVEGNLLRGRTSGNIVQAGTAMGATVFALVASAALTRRWRRRLDELAVAAAALVVVGLSIAYLGGPVLALAQRLPGVAESSPARARFLFVMGVALLAGAGAQALLQRVPRGRVLYGWPRLVGRLAAATVVVVGLWALDVGLDAAVAAGRADDVVAAAIPAGVALALVLALALAAAQWRGARRVVVPLLALVIAGELVVGTQGQQPVVSADAVFPTFEDMASLPAHGEGRFTATRIAPWYVMTNASHDLPDARTNWPGPGRYQDLLALADPMVPWMSEGGATIVGVPTEWFDVGHPVVDRLAITQVLHPLGSRPLDLVDRPTAGAVVGADGRELVLPLPAAGEAWRWLALGPVPECRLPLEVVLHHGDHVVARRRWDAPVHDGAGWLMVTVPDLGAGRLGVAFPNCPAARVEAARLFAGSTERLRLEAADGWQRYANTAARPFVELTADVHTLPLAEHRLWWLQLAEADAGAAVEQAPPWPLGHPGGVELVEVEPDRQRLRATSHEGWSLLTVRENHAPGWEATVDGEPAEVVHVDHAFRGVWIPEGTHEVEFRYAPAGLRTGTRAAALSLLALAAWAALASRRAQRRSRPAPAG